MRTTWLWWVAFVAVLLPGQLAVGMRASTTATVTGDEPFYLLTAQSLVSDGDLDLRDEYRRADEEMARFWDGTKPLWRQMEPAPDGRLLSPHDPGLSLLVTPAYALGGLEGVRRFLVVVWAAAMACAALLARRIGAPWWAALLGAVGVGAAAPGLVYASQVYPEGPAALCIAAGLLAAGATPYRAGGRRRSSVVSASALLASVIALEWLGVKYLPYALIVVGLWAWRHRSDRRLLAVGGGVLAVAAAHYLWWHVHTFGGLTPYATNVVYAGEGTSSILVAHLDIPDRTYRLYGLFLDARFGLLRWLPLALLALLGIRRRTWSHGAVVGTGVALGTFVSITMMGYWFPGRMLIAGLPSLAVLVAVGATRLPVVSGVLAAWSWAIAAAVAVAASPGRRLVRLAVDPWQVGFPLAPAAWFPDFRTFATRQVVLSLAWAAAAFAFTRLAPRLGRTWRSTSS